ncbi:regulator of chromosome condensation (RCC1) family protein [Actinidia rufa]|uniref:Regulator of chromosome condensation (RCC1) family protein n=1 Tax=Actinidia rufa TaxID=165716 RepID=A0A7J0GHW5_9ERIC|nr:regulator of chromosome condensation (RCC1) family protein [Actinidia rufa]
MSEEDKKAEEEEAVNGGELLFCGTTSWDTVGRKKIPGEGNLVSPTRLRPLIGVDIRLVVSGCGNSHCSANLHFFLLLVTVWHWMLKGVAILGGKGQLGHGDTIQRDRPTVVSELSKHKIISAGSGRSHTVVVTEDGLSFAFGWNKHGQLGSGSVKNEIESSPVRCLVSEVKNATCGGDFTVWLTSAEGASILTAGLPIYGQLGHGTDNEYNTKDSSVRLAYEAQPRPKAIASLAGETIVKVACGTNHTGLDIESRRMSGLLAVLMFSQGIMSCSLHVDPQVLDASCKDLLQFDQPQSTNFVEVPAHCNWRISTQQVEHRSEDTPGLDIVFNASAILPPLKIYNGMKCTGEEEIEEQMV